MSRLYDWLLGLFVRIEVEGWYLTDRDLRDRARAYEAFVADGGDPASITRVERAYGVGAEPQRHWSTWAEVKAKAAEIRGS